MKLWTIVSENPEWMANEPLCDSGSGAPMVFLTEAAAKADCDSMDKGTEGGYLVLGFESEEDDASPNAEYKRHVLGLLKAEGPCTMARITKELRSQTTGPWDQCRGGSRKISATWTAVECLNELCREGNATLYDTGDAWDAVYD